DVADRRRPIRRRRRAPLARAHAFVSGRREAARRRAPRRALREAQIIRARHTFSFNSCQARISRKMVPGTNFPEMRAWHEFLFGAEVGRRVGAFAEEELLHLALEELARFRLDRREAVFVDQHGLVAEPALPCELRNVLVDAFTELAGIRRLVEAFGLGAEHYAMDGSCHAVSSPCLGSRSSSARIGAAMPRFDRAALYHTRLSDSMTAAQSVSSLTSRCAIVR